MSQKVRNSHGSKGAWHGDGYKTTVVLTGVPRTLNAELLLSLLDQDYFGWYDFFYLPMDMGNFQNIGIVYINFRNNAKALKCRHQFSGSTAWPGGHFSERKCKADWFSIQGYEANIQELQSQSDWVNSNIPEDCKPMVFDEHGTRLPTSEVFQPWPEAYQGWRSSETHQAQGDAYGNDQWQYQEKWYHGGDLYDKPGWNVNSSPWFGMFEGSPTDQSWQSDHGRRENLQMDRTWDRDKRGSWNGSVRWDGTAALSVLEEARDITPWGLQEVEGFGDAASNGTGATDQDPKGSASEQIPLDAPTFCEETLASLAVTNYACPKCSACFAKWSACHRHIFSEVRCRKEVAERVADQNLQALCKAKAKEFPADEFRNGRNGHSTGPQHAPHDAQRRFQ